VPCIQRVYDYLLPAQNVKVISFTLHDTCLRWLIQDLEEKKTSKKVGNIKEPEGERDN
jgi:hypothetical protein